MTRAYDETYLDDAMNNLGDMFDYAVNDCGYGGEDFFSRFIASGVAELFEKGNPRYVAGLSGPELASEVIFKTQRARLDTLPSDDVDKSAEYWAGWVMAYYQWYTGRPFSYMQKYGLTMERVLSLYPTLHEADISKFMAVAAQFVRKDLLRRQAVGIAAAKARGVTFGPEPLPLPANFPDLLALWQRGEINAADLAKRCNFSRRTLFYRLSEGRKT